MNFVNAQDMAAKHDTFDAPLLSDIRNDIKPGMFVKVCDSEERFWVRVDEVLEHQIKGIVFNNLVFSSLKHGDCVTVDFEEIYDMYADEVGEDDNDETDNIRGVHGTCN
jgi:hypothetical protein